MITLGLVANVDTSGVYVMMPGSKGVLRGPYETVQNVTAGDKVLMVTTDDGDNVIVGLAGASVPKNIADPGTVTDNAIVRWDGTSGSAVQNSGVTIDDNNNIIMPTASGTNAVFDIRAAESGRNAGITIRTGTSRRWAINKDATGESGSNVGSDLQISRYDDSDVGLGAVIFLKRSTGRVTISNVGATAGLEFGASGPTITTGTGAPSHSAPNGSVYLRTGGTASTTLYVRAAGSWSALS